MVLDGSGGYRSTFAPRTNTRYETPVPHRRGYTEVQLTTWQHGAVVAGCSTACAWATPPLLKLERFYFLSDVPGESSRIYMSDKRAQFFRVLFHTRWWHGRSVVWLAGEYGLLLSTFITLRSLLESSTAATAQWSNRLRGFVSGALTGAVYAAMRHPYDVLRATAEAPGGPRRFRGPADVVVTALRERPRLLLGVYRGLRVALSGRMCQFGLQFGLYNWLRYDGVYRNAAVLFLYCHLATFAGMAAQYPLQSLRQQLHAINATVRGRPLTHRSLFLSLRRRHGITKLYDGFFRGKPLLNAVPMALLMTAYDMSARRLTELLHPDAVAAPTHTQSLTSIAPPSHVLHPPPYEFEHQSR
ncbi:Mitochondrial carrier protein [Novymonas esmeraldas]|uniref:Mitochondrial carrier protein n=1 Tax=Novymonas esmeraldas TaxID=1808958 RepID=A0AAW0F649_9TRYP